VLTLDDNVTSLCSLLVIPVLIIVSVEELKSSEDCALSEGSILSIMELLRVGTLGDCFV